MARLEGDLFFWLFILSAIINIAGVIFLMVLEGLSAFASFRIAYIKLAHHGRAVLVSDPSGIGELVSGKFTGTHLVSKKYGDIVWTPGSFSLFGLKVGTADSDIGTTIPPHIAQRLQVLEDMGFTDIKEAELSYRLLKEKWTIEKVSKRLDTLKLERKKTLEESPEDKKIIHLDERIKMASEYLALLEKIERHELTKKDFENICQAEIRLIDFKELFRWVTYWINPKMTEIAVSEGKLEEREELDKKGTQELKWLVGMAFLFLAVCMGVMLLYYTFFDNGSPAQAPNLPSVTNDKDKIGMSLNSWALLLAVIFRRRLFSSDLRTARGGPRS